MKKIISIILSAAFLIMLMGCNEISNKNKNSSTEETTITDEDKAVKAEIAKFNDTAADFKYNRQQTINGETYDLVFARVGFAETNNDESKRVTYKNSDGDEFVYDVNTGKLKLVHCYSDNIEKDEKSISINDAEKIAYEFASHECNISEYTLCESKEIFRGYDFVYSRYIDGYETTDNIGVTIGFDGSLVYMGIFTDTFEGVEINIDEDWINSKLNEVLSKFQPGTAEIANKRISIKDGKPCLIVEIACGVSSDDSIGAAGRVYSFAFDE